MTEEELLKEIELQKKTGYACAQRLNPVVKQIFTDSREFFDKNLVPPPNLEPQEAGCCRFTTKSHRYSLFQTHGHLEIFAFDLRTHKTQKLLDCNEGCINAFINGNWEQEIVKFAAELHTGLEPERIYQQQLKKKERQQSLHQQAKAFGLTSPYSFADTDSLHSTSPRNQLEHGFKIMFALIVIISIIYIVVQLGRLQYGS